MYSINSTVISNLTDCLKVAESTLGTAMEHQISQGEQRAE